MNSELTMVLGLLDNGHINVDQAERLIRRLNGAATAFARPRPDLKRPADRVDFLPPHFPSGFGAPCSAYAATI